MKTLREELIEWSKDVPVFANGDMREQFEAILSRHPEDEPLAVLADKKGWWIDAMGNTTDEWFIQIKRGRAYENKGWESFEDDTYAKAESKAREYLEGLEDKI